MVVIIKPYYRDDRVNTVDSISNTIEELLLKNDVSQNDIDNASKLVVGNNVCALIFNEEGQSLYDSDSLGQMCMLNKNITLKDNEINIKKNPLDFITVLNSSEPLKETINSDITNSEMLLYGKVIRNDLANYYLVINTPLEPIESYVNFIMNQYLYVAVFVVIIALLVAFFLAKSISSPIVKMKKEANKLADGDYDVSFKTDSFSEINELAQTLDDATDKLSKVDELRKDLVANVSHDIKTPLTMIKAYAEMIKDISGEDPEKRNEHLDVIIKETDYLNKLVTDMSQLSKLQSGNIEISKNNFDLKQMVLDVVELLKDMLPEKKVKLSLNLDETIAYADEIKIKQVVYNFISNAIKHSKDEGVVKINLINSSEDIIRLEVIDTGDGISEESLPYIWDRYYKVDKNFNRSIESTGLGLAIAKAILEAHKAKYGVTSKINEGSTFYFELSKDYE